MKAAAVMAVENAMERVEAITETMAVVAAMAAATMAVKKAMESVVAIAEAMVVENAVEKTLAMAVEARRVARQRETRSDKLFDSCNAGPHSTFSRDRAAFRCVSPIEGERPGP